MSFRIVPLTSVPESPLSRRVLVDKKPGYPCRISLEDAEIGEEVLLVHYEHQSAATPFRASHAIYVRPGAVAPTPSAGEIPEMLRSRLLSLRGFSAEGMLIRADVADGATVEHHLEDFFRVPDVDYVHLHFAKPGCYAACAVRD